MSCLIYILCVCWQRAPRALAQLQPRSDMLRVWVAALLDKGGRLGAQRLTLALAANPATASLFSSIEQEEVRASPGEALGTLTKQLFCWNFRCHRQGLVAVSCWAG
jgi:hypothetical protein